MRRLLINLTFVLLLPFFKVERLISDLQKGRKVAMIKLYHLVMDSRHNPLSHIPDTNTRHLVMQVLAWMWCVIFAISTGSITVFGISAVAHSLLIAGVVGTVATFELARSQPNRFIKLGRGMNGDLD